MFRGKLPRTLRSTSILPATNVCPHVAEYSTSAFPCALRGPFDDLFSARFPAPQALCESIIAVIPASSVCYSLFCETVLKIALQKLFVKDNFLKSFRIVHYNHGIIRKIIAVGRLQAVFNDSFNVLTVHFPFAEAPMDGAQGCNGFSVSFFCITIPPFCFLFVEGSHSRKSSSARSPL